jgi:hypothetical protein
MKHGPIALINEELPVIVLIPHDAVFHKTLSNLKEVESRGLRYWLAYDHRLCRTAERLRAALRSAYRRQARRQGVASGETGMVTSVQRDRGRNAMAIWRDLAQLTIIAKTKQKAANRVESLRKPRTRADAQT